MNRQRKNRPRWRDERGQTFTEYTMILGLLTAIIISLTGIIVPGFARVVIGLVRTLVVCMSSVNCS